MHSKHKDTGRNFKYNSMKGPNDVAEISEPLTLSKSSLRKEIFTKFKHNEIEKSVYDWSHINKSDQADK